jgi:hypothetical protein
MNKTEAGTTLKGKGERRFFIQLDPPKLIIKDEEVKSHPNHKEIACYLVGTGVLASTPLGGYCNERKGVVGFWAGTAGSLPSAKKEQFDNFTEVEII